MLKKTAVENILTAALESGADFAEIYAEEAKRSSISMVNGKIESALGGMDYGAGVRLFFGNQAIYGFSNRTRRLCLLQNSMPVITLQYKSELQSFPLKTQQYSLHR